MGGDSTHERGRRKPHDLHRRSYAYNGMPAQLPLAPAHSSAARRCALPLSPSVPCCIAVVRKSALFSPCVPLSVLVRGGFGALALAAGASRFALPFYLDLQAVVLPCC